MRLLLVLVGGSLGSGVRYLVSIWMASRFSATFPWGTLTVNVLGGFVVGLVATLADEAGSVAPEARLFLVVGVLGGFTTFSSFSLEAWRLAEQNELLQASLYVLGSLFLSLATVALGVAAGRLLGRANG